MSDNSIDANGNNKTNSNSKQVNNNNSEKATDRDNKCNEKVKEIRALKTQ